MLPKLKKLIKSDCAGFNKTLNNKTNFCIQVDDTCMFFVEMADVQDTNDTQTGDNQNNLPKCKYFEEGVLPLLPDLERQYHEYHKSELSITTKHKPKVRKKCEKCDEPILATSNRQKYCEKCKKAIQREQQKERKQRQRKVG
ncbi:formylmethanofuran dehydrogenase subunit E [Desulfitispora alkaliphila]|uniref:hypothetical protein n=1 Tax=Desulfitispora alkaliphila TaxID=622674 RepID=UPI003D222480